MHAFKRRAEKVRNVLGTGVTKSVGLVVDEGAEGASQWHNRRPSGRFQAGDQSQQVRDEHEQAQCNQKWREAFAVMPDDVMTLTFDKSVKPFEDMLQASGIFD